MSLRATTGIRLGIGVMTITSVAACLVPAWRATRTDPPECYEIDPYMVKVYRQFSRGLLSCGLLSARQRDR